MTGVLRGREVWLRGGIIVMGKGNHGVDGMWGRGEGERGINVERRKALWG